MKLQYVKGSKGSAKKKHNYPRDSSSPKDTFLLVFSQRTLKYLLLHRIEMFCELMTLKAEKGHRVFLDQSADIFPYKNTA